MDASRAPERSSRARLVLVTIVTGVAAGLVGLTLLILLHFTQHVAYGYSLHAIIGELSFLEGVSRASPMRRVAVMTFCGLVAGVGWWAIYRFGRAPVSVASAVNADARMSVVTTIAHALLQIVTVGLGSPLGREVAPREVAALIAERIADRARLSREERRILLACAAGAGLAAVYNVPFGGALFSLEVLLESAQLSAIVPALATSVIAALVAWIGIGDEVPYAVKRYGVGASLIAFAIVAGPVFGVAALGFTRLAEWARWRAPRDLRLLVWCPLTLCALGWLSVPFPQLLGNGKGPTLLGFQGELGLGLAMVLAALKLVAITGSLRAGAHGGVLTPSLALGALLGTVLGWLWTSVSLGATPHPSLGAFAIVGATAFLAATSKMPITATVLTIEFTRVEHEFWFPLLFAVAGAVATARLGARGPVAHHIRD